MELSCAPPRREILPPILDSCGRAEVATPDLALEVCDHENARKLWFGRSVLRFPADSVDHATHGAGVLAERRVLQVFVQRVGSSRWHHILSADIYPFAKKN